MSYYKQNIIRQLKDGNGEPSNDEKTIIKLESEIRNLTAQVDAYKQQVEELEKTQLPPEKEQGWKEEISYLRTNLNSTIEENVVSI